MSLASEADLLRRALAAHFRGGAQEQPSKGSDVVILGKKTYVVLRNVRGIIAVYRELNSGQLKKLRRYPKELD